MLPCGVVVGASAGNWPIEADGAAETQVSKARPGATGTLISIVQIWATRPNSELLG
jgi:hypothetical protein